MESPLDSSHEDMLSQSERHFHGKAFVSSATAAMFELAEYHETIKSPLCLSVNSGLDEEAGASPGTSVTLHVSGGGSPDTIFQLRYDIGGPRANDDADEDDECSRTKDQREEGYLYFTSPSVVRTSTSPAWWCDEERSMWSGIRQRMLTILKGCLCET